MRRMRSMDTVLNISDCEGEPAVHAALAVYADMPDARLRDYPGCENGLFMAESRAVIAAALDAGARPHSLLVENRWLDEGVRALAARLGDANPDASILVATHEEFVQATGYEISRGPIAAFERPALPSLEAVLSGARRVAVLEDVGNYANIAAAFRAAAVFGIDAVLVTPSCHDPLYRRAARVSGGAVLRVPWARIGRERHWAAEGVPALHRAGFKVAALALSDDSIPLGDPELAACERLALVLGTEAHGLFPDTIAACDFTVRIPMSHGVDSLNVAVASAVAFWELRTR